MTKILKPMPLRSPGGERQPRVQSVERLDRALFIDTEDRGVERWLHVQTNNVSRLLFKLRVVAGHVTTRAMRLNTEMAPDPADTGLAHAQLFGQPIAAPMGGPIGRTSPRGLHDPGLPLGGTRPRLTPPITRIQSCQTLFLKALLPLPDILVAAIQTLPNFTVRMT